MKSIKIYLYVALIAVGTILTSTMCNAQFHAGIDVKYSVGVCEEDIDLNKVDNTNSLGINVSGLYEFTPQIWAGVGITTNINDKSMMVVEDYTVTKVPIMQFAPYITMRYRPFTKHLNAYVFTDLGYALPFSIANNVQSFSEGVMWNAGVGYSLMFAKHFGLNFNVGYNLQQIKGTPYLLSSSNSDTKIASNNIRHSVAFAIGLIF